MSTATIPRPAPAPVGRTSTPRVRPVRRAVPVRGPQARPARVAPAPKTEPGRSAAVRSCRLDVELGATSGWQLTDRGIAVVLVLAAMIMVAAMTVVGLTAWQVTGPGDEAWSATAGAR